MAYKIITHDRKAHIDEVLASALLSIHLGEEPTEIIRMSSQLASEKVKQSEPDPDVWFLDCGMVHDPERRLFDHHQDNQLGCAASLVFQEFFPHLQDSELADYIQLVSKVDTRGLRVLDDYDEVHESQSYWSFSQKLLMKSFETNPKAIVTLFREGLEDKIRFEQAKKKASLWLETEHHTEIQRVGEINVLLYHVQPPEELASAIRAVDGKIVDEHEIDAIYSFDDKEPENRVFFRTNGGHDRLDFTRSSPAHIAFCHQGGFLMKFIPENDQEWIKIIKASALA
ncbi:MAG: hypothetical protein B6241_09515 [Spirochaetaceae bacterium 4572_59]|nr:MAG: hypothetical protein B6241_09515 [Spirochaetaceae bacterium 4572_59]